jgi:hypothetical protein
LSFFICLVDNSERFFFCGFHVRFRELHAVFFTHFEHYKTESNGSHAKTEQTQHDNLP